MCVVIKTVLQMRFQWSNEEDLGLARHTTLIQSHLVSGPDRHSSPSLKQSGDPSPKGRFNGRDMGGVMSGIIEVSEIVHASKAV